MTRKTASILGEPITDTLTQGVAIRIIDTTGQSSPAGKLADVELHFTEGLLAGLKLIGFAVWERRAATGGRNVTFPSRVYTVNGERRAYALLRPLAEVDAQTRVSAAILQAYAEYEAKYRDADGFVWAPDGEVR